MADAPLYQIDLTSLAPTVAGSTGFQFPIGGDIFIEPVPPPAVTVNNVPPANVILNAGVIDENGVFSLSGSFTDPGTLDTHTVVIDWGPSQGTTTLELAAGVISFSASHQYLDDGSSPGNGTAWDLYTVSVSVTDDDQGEAPADTATTTVTVNNLAPHDVAIDQAVQAYVFATGAPQTFAGVYADAGTLDTHTAVWTFTHVVGASTIVETRSGTVSETGGSGTVSDTFVFDNDPVNQDGPGVYTVTLTITDDDTGATMSESRTFVVYDPSEGFVTGGGWIDSPAGAYVADPSLTGKATFGFISKYQKGASAPVGQTEFQFKVADLNFHSASYEWLVVAGARGQYKGTGTINGAGNYGFLLTAIDGQVSGGGGADKFRMKIWDRNAGDAVIYDNGGGAADDAAALSELAGGSILIHTNGQALHLDGPVAVGGEALLTAGALGPVVTEAIDAWAAAGASAVQIEALRRVDVQLASLSGELLGIASDINIIWIDSNAGGFGWNVNSFAGGIDLASVLAHEFGHVLGLEDLPYQYDVMGSHLAPDALRMPTYFSLEPLKHDSNSGGSYLGISPLASDALFAEGFGMDDRDSITLDENRTEDLEVSLLGFDEARSVVAVFDWPLKRSWVDAVLASLAGEESNQDQEDPAEMGFRDDDATAQ